MKVYCPVQKPRAKGWANVQMVASTWQPVACSRNFLAVPAKLHSDQGQNFEAQVLAAICKCLGVP